jgi:hypothetical protein
MVNILLYVGGLLATLAAVLVAGLMLTRLAPTHDRLRRERLRAQGLTVLPARQSGWQRRLEAARTRSRRPPPAA